MDADPPIDEIPLSLDNVWEAVVKLRDRKADGAWNISMKLCEAGVVAMILRQDQEAGV